MTDIPVPNVAHHVYDDKPITQDLLPDTLYELLAVAINDARQLNPHAYCPSSKRWHRSRMGSHCEVCLAGSIIARTYRSSPNLDILPTMFSLRIRKKLCAIDNMRCGKWLHAYLMLYETAAPLAIEKRLLDLPKPTYIDFKGWLQFNTHLDSLEPIMYKLRAIELDAVKA